MPSDDQVRQHVYQRTVTDGLPPGSPEVATALDMTPDAVLESFRRLNARRLLALAPSGEIVMAPPFSAVPTPFHVISNARSYFANCVWDAYGIAAALHQDTDVHASCACCGERMFLSVRNGRPSEGSGVAHFAVPAAHWWDDIVYT